MGKISSDTSLLHADLKVRVETLLQKLRERDIDFRVFEAFRSAKRQAELYGQGRPNDPLYSKGPVVTKARPWSGFHQYGLAVDLVIDAPGVNPWSTERPYHLWWEHMHAAARRLGLRPLSFELCHVEMAVPLLDLRNGKYPPGGGSTWALNLSRAIDEYPMGAPPKPREE